MDEKISYLGKGGFFKKQQNNFSSRHICYSNSFESIKNNFHEKKSITTVTFRDANIPN